MVKSLLSTINWNHISHFLKPVVPVLSYLLHKGELGRIAVIGGSIDYTGAPFYSAHSALKFGADLAFVLCSSSAALPIKSYSPELMVSSFYDDQIFFSSELVTPGLQKVMSKIGRAHSAVIGPGLGDSLFAQSISTLLIQQLKNEKRPTVIDADGLLLLVKDIRLLTDFTQCVITPNKVEFGRLVDAAVMHVRQLLAADASDRAALEWILQELQLRPADLASEARQLRALSAVLHGVTVLKKGRYDMISSGGAGDVYLVKEEGSPRRCGGQGDILAGSLGVALHWAMQKKEELAHLMKEQSTCPSGEAVELPPLPECFGLKTEDQLSSNAALHAAILASVVVRRASVLAFRRHGRSMTSPDVIDCIGEAFVALGIDEEKL